MPRSKHRRKPGTKAVRNPGRNKTPPPPWRPSPVENAAKDTAWHQFKNNYSDALHQALPPGENDAAEFMAELISEVVFRFEAGTASLGPASKEDVFDDFTSGLAVIDLSGTGKPVAQQFTKETAETALAQLVALGLAEVEDEQITVPLCFLCREEKQSLAAPDESEPPPLAC